MKTQVRENAEPRTTWQIITPKHAQHWLDTSNSNNRPMRENYANKMSEDMVAGKWKVNGEAIQISKTGQILDGQHRLKACVIANLPFKSLVVFDLEDDVYETIDIGRTRSLSNFLHRNHKASAIRLGSVIRSVYLWKIDKLDQLKNSKYAPTIQQHLQTLEQHPFIEESVAFVSKRSLTMILQASISGLLHFAACEKGEQKQIETFLERLASGIGLSTEEAVFHLRNNLLKQKNLSRGQNRPANIWYFAMAIKAWNLHKAGKPVKVLRWTSREGFPKL